MDLIQLKRNLKCLPSHAVENCRAQLWVNDVVIQKSALVTVNENFDKFFNYFTLKNRLYTWFLNKYIQTAVFTLPLLERRSMHESRTRS